MKINGQHTIDEIINQPKAWSQALEAINSLKDEVDRLCHNRPQSRLLFTGCGSTYYLSIAAASLFQELTGWGARAFPAGELIFYPDTAYEPSVPTLLIAVSRSGSTTETVEAVRRFKQAGRGPVIVITNYDSTPLAELGDLTIGIPAGQEKSVAQTRSFSSMYVALTALAAVMAVRNDLLKAMDKLPACGEALIHKYGPLARDIGENLDLDRFYFLGSGPRYGLACEANLKMKEMTLTHSEPFHFLEFRHGPMSMVNTNSAIAGLLSHSNRRHEEAVLHEMAQLGGRTISLTDQDCDVAFQSGLPEQITGVLHLPVLQLAAYYRSLAKGLDPDNPQNLTAVVELDL